MILKKQAQQPRSPNVEKEEKWNNFFHVKKDEGQPKKEYVKMSDRTIVVDKRHTVSLNQNLRSRSTIHASTKAKSIIGTNFQSE